MRKAEDWRVNLAWALFITPAILLLPMTWAALSDPSVVLDYWEIYLPLYGLPYAAALALWLHARRSRRSI